MMFFLQTVEVSMCILAFALEVFPTDKTSIDVHVGQGDGAQFFEIEVKIMFLDGAQERTDGTIHYLVPFDFLFILCFP